MEHRLEGKKAQDRLCLCPPNPSTLLFSSLFITGIPNGYECFSARFSQSCVLTIASSCNRHLQGRADLHSSAEGTPVNPFLQRCGSLNNKSRGQTWLSLLLKKPIARSFLHRDCNTRGLLWREQSGQTQGMCCLRELFLQTCEICSFSSSFLSLTVSLNYTYYHVKKKKTQRPAVHTSTQYYQHPCHHQGKRTAPF